MNDQFRQLAERIEAAKKAVLALETYMAQVREAIAQMQAVIAEAEALVAPGPPPE
jgi:acetate kinase